MTYHKVTRSHPKLLQLGAIVNCVPWQQILALLEDRVKLTTDLSQRFSACTDMRFQSFKTFQDISRPCSCRFFGFEIRMPGSTGGLQTLWRESLVQITLSLTVWKENIFKMSEGSYYSRSDVRGLQLCHEILFVASCPGTHGGTTSHKPRLIQLFFSS